MHDNEAEIIGKWGEDLVRQLLEDTFGGAATSREDPDRGTDLLCKIKAPRPNLPSVEWRIQVKATTKPKTTAWNLPSGRIEALKCMVKGRRIKEYWFSQGLDSPHSPHWLLFNVIFADDFAKLARMPWHLRLSNAAVYVVDMIQAIERLGLNDQIISEDSFGDRYHDVGTPVANEATPSLLTFLWASHAWAVIQKPIKDASQEIRAINLQDGDLRLAQEVWNSLRSPFQRLVTKFPLAVRGINRETYQRVKRHTTRAGDVVLTLQADFVEDVLLCLMDSKNHSVFRNLFKTSVSGGTWVMQVGRRVVNGAIFESILAHQFARLMTARGYRVVIIPENEERIIPEVSIPGFGAIVSGFYEPGLEFENTKQSDREASERRAFYLRAPGGLRLSKPADVLNPAALECFGLEQFRSKDLDIAHCPIHLLPDMDCLHIAQCLTSRLVIPETQSRH